MLIIIYSMIVEENSNSRYILLTVDTEFSNHKGTLGVWGEIHGQKYGLTKIIELCNRYGVKATFFVDVYQKEREIRRACELIKENGHDIQLHTHPNWLYDRKRENLNHYSFNEQCEIIRYGKEKLTDWVGQVPTVHRAGDFALNADIFGALKANGIFYDFSYFHQWPECQVTSPLNLKNSVTEIDSVLEIPVTCFRVINFGLSKIPHLIDINESFALLSELFDHLEKKDFRTIVIVLHSFSFLGYNETPCRSIPRRHIYWPLENNIQNFDKLLAMLTKRDSFRFVTAREYVSIARLLPENVMNPDIIPLIGLKNSMNRLFIRAGRKLCDRFYRTRKNCAIQVF